MTLHTLNQGPAQRSCLDSCLRALSSSDTLLLIEDGVYWALPGLAAQLPPGLPVYALEADLQARGLTSALPAVDDAGFVELCVNHDRTVSWF